MTTLNINDEVEVTLTEFGWEVLRDHYLRLGLTPPSRLVGNNPIRMQLWDLMSTYGPVIYMGMAKMPFVRNEVRLASRALAVEPSEGERLKVSPTSNR